MPATPEKDDDGYRLTPIDVTDDVWLYESAKGVSVLRRGRTSSGEYVCTTEAKLPWKVICALADSHRKIEAAKKRI